MEAAGDAGTRQLVDVWAAATAAAHNGGGVGSGVLDDSHGDDCEVEEIDRWAGTVLRKEASVE